MPEGTSEITAGNQLEMRMKKRFWSEGATCWATHSYPKAGATKALWPQMPGPRLVPLSHIQPLTFIHRMEDPMLTFTSDNALMQDTKSSLNMSSVSVILTCSVQSSSVTQSCPTLRNPMNCSTPGLLVHQQLPEFTQTHVHRVGDAIQPFHPLSSPSPPAPKPSQHQSLFQWVSSLNQVAKVLEFQL